MIPRPPAPAPDPSSVAQPPLRPGSNVRMGSNALGMWVQGPASGVADFRHPFQVSVSGNDCRVSRGLIIGNLPVEPTIGNSPISGRENEPRPLLKLNPSMVNSRGESWVCVDVGPDEDGLIGKEGTRWRVEVTQRDHPIVTVGGIGRAPLAMLLFGNGRPQVFQIAMFHLRYVTSQPTDGPRQHFFL